MHSKTRHFLFLTGFFLLVVQSLFALEAYRGSIFHFLTDPNDSTSSEPYEYFEDGILIVNQGKVVSVGKAADQLPKISSETELHVYDKNTLIIPGFIDTHIHFPQVDMIASYGEQLLEWLDKYTFPHEKRFWDKEYSQKIAHIFIQELLRNGTTTALVFASASRDSVESLFEVVQSRNMRIISGNALGDRNLPDYLLKPVPSCYHETKDLIKKWHGNGRLLYAITPRFAPTSSEEQLKMIEGLLEEYPDVYVHTHLSENLNEVA